MKSSAILALAPLAALAAAMPQAQLKQAHQRANVTAGHLPFRKAHHKSLEARQTPEDPQNSNAFAGPDWINGYNNIQAISGQVIIPSLTWRSDGPETQLLSLWVGIEGTNCNEANPPPVALAQTGIVGQVYSDGSMDWYPFYEWADYESEQKISNFPVSAGDTLLMQIILNSPTSATANLDNKSTGQTISINFSGPTICPSNANWWIEDICYTNSFSNCALAEFDSFYMTDAYALANDDYINAQAGSVCTLTRDGQEYVRVGDSTSNIIYEYVGPK